MRSLKDGFNYTATNIAGTLKIPPKFIKVDCFSAHHGLPKVSAPNTNNATTAHQGALGIRFGETSYNTTGAVAANVHAGTKTVNYSRVAFDPLTRLSDGSDATSTA